MHVALLPLVFVCAGDGCAADLVDVTEVVPDAVLDLRYATADNFVGERLYPVARCLLDRRAADRLARAAATLREQGYRLVLWDCYRPASVQRRLWDRIQDERYVARVSNHSRGAAVDVSLADAAGAPLAMPTAHDHFGPEAHRDHAPADRAVAARLRTLDAAMTAAGFDGLPTEWWHYAVRDPWRYPLRDAPLTAP